jgi:hypothetical protein
MAIPPINWGDHFATATGRRIFHPFQGYWSELGGARQFVVNEPNMPWIEDDTWHCLA